MTDAEKAYQYFVIAVPENEEQAKAYFWARKALQSTLTPPNEALTCEGCYWKTHGSFGQCFDFVREKQDNYRRPPEGEKNNG